MRDDRNNWDAPRSDDKAVTIGAVTLRPVHLDRQTIISGPDVLTQTRLPLGAWPDTVLDDTYALSLRCDRILIVNGPPVMDGWDDTMRQAASDTSDAYKVFDLTGTGALAVLMRGTELNLAVESRSVIRLLFGLGVFLYRYKSEEGFRVHVGCAHADALWKNLQTAAESLKTENA